MHLRVAQNAARLANAGAQPVREKRAAQSAPEPKVPKEPGQRLADLRIKAGYKTREEAQKAINKKIRDESEKISLSLYHQHESGIRTITIAAATKYEQHFGVPEGYILYGGTKRFRARVHGTVGADGIVLNKAKITTEVDVALETDGITICRVEGKKLSPMFQNGDIFAFSEAAFSAPVDRKAIVGRRCIIQTGAGSEVVAIVVSMTTDGKATLYMPSGRERSGVTVVRAAPILWTKHPT